MSMVGGEYSEDSGVGLRFGWHPVGATADWTSTHGRQLVCWHSLSPANVLVLSLLQ